MFDQGEENGEPYAVFEYLPGGSLEQRLEAGPLSDADAQRIAADVSAALAYAHAEGVTHGSLGPETILLDGEGQAKVAGFAGDATPEEDEQALAALLQILGASAAVAAGDDVTAVLRPAPAASSRRRPVALAALAALVLLGAGVGAALVATSGDSKPDGAPGSVSLPASPGSTEAPVVAPPATTSEETTTNEPTTAPATTEPPATTDAPGDERAAADHGAARDDGTASRDERASAHDGASAGDDRAAADHRAAGTAHDRCGDRNGRLTCECRRWESNPHSPRGTGF